MASNYLILFIISAIVLQSCSLINSKLNQNKVKEKKAKIYYNQGTNNLLQKKYTDALKQLLSAAKYKPKDSKIQNNLGMAYYLKNDNKKAIYHLKKSIDINSENSEALNNLASIYMVMNKNDKAEKLYNKLLKNLVYKFQFRTHYNLGLLNLKRGKEEGAIKHFKQSIKANNNYCPPYYQLGLLLKSREQYDKAYEYFKKATTGECVKEPAPHYEQAMTLIKLNSPQKAFIKLREIMQKFPSTKYAKDAKKYLYNINFTNKNKSI